MKVKKGARIAIVVSEYNPEITDALYASCVDELLHHGVAEKNIERALVPGAFELPLACERLAQTKKVDAIIALGCIIKGQTPHFDYIAFAVAQGIMTISLQSRIPVVFGVLTTHNARQARARIRSGSRGDKGKEAAITALKMI
ncbi:6,7-dimethyl-8-ribityllumazine synthase [Candidatus Peregrinibacteria bacterium]|nr:MAG: 6,7-dimethyl-8-ribityllumazine synthase [Candidatus Peregrinibacteria bacterium]